MAFSAILVANRGEIAVRILRTAKRLGYGTVAVYSDADSGAPHVAMADRSVRLGPAPSRESYLCADKIIAACRAAGADAVHPGYGFLSENAQFAEACTAAGLTFIGPPAKAIALMGNKSRAKQLMREARVPCVPGYDGTDQSEATFGREAARIGYPVMVKAAAGGGGRGMRLVQAPDVLPDALASARAESEKAFGSGELLIEKAIVRPRHVEIQVFADTHGNAVHLGERDCSVQRRHQKVIEESPCPVMTPQLRKEMGDAAVGAARAIGYVGAGTVEFLLDEQGHFYFLEMNTRLQVEHPVTELVTGLDLVEWQIEVAAGRPLPLSQEEVSLNGHAIEARLYAEDRNFVPQTGRIRRWRPAPGTDVRVDAGVREGSEIGPHYDSMLAKLVAHGTTRDDARRKLVAGLRQTAVLGLTTNKEFLAQLCEHPVFAGGQATTAFIADHFSAVSGEAGPSDTEWMSAALVFFLRGARRFAGYPPGWRSGRQIPAVFRLASEERRVTVRMTLGRSSAPGESGELCEIAVTPDSHPPDAPGEVAQTVKVRVARFDDDGLTVFADGVSRSIAYAIDGDAVHLDAGNGTCRIEDVTNVPPAAKNAAGSGILAAPMDGTLVKVCVKAGDRVAVGQLVMIVEAMKMEHRLAAGVAGVVVSINAVAGTLVRSRQKLAEIAPDEAVPEGNVKENGLV